MKKAMLAVTMLGLASLAGVAHADTKKPVQLWLCSDYLEVNETYRPTALGFAEAVNKKGKVEDAVVDLEGIEKIKPSLLTYCKENPKIALRDALDNVRK
ncbi:acid-activated periplasmic chaperone HdeA [Bordetella avium]|uniref:acid-activated periplasmic chaperone HdeA n=1 Tax=Bordetella avium TaxID=521 RepID=UPI000E0B04FE|nr:acid-activated periplasmic chaperone HdeA [Bordetella avium]RIQ13078.1 acid-resistance protein [Bordetella avium]RIQ54064.1 acid-resistance protein [Bordetella avium]RIQ62464.1 acid-resistance protein [Bordetella avium]RIQ63587.1 acid-resistance protein [Bordetella avium]RIQ78832.1 acid-resistance protein [Bordetella avium]